MKNLHNKKILFFTDHYGPMLNNYQAVEKLYNFNFIRFKKNRFYKMFYQHKSSLGNELIAKIYLNALTGKQKFFLKKIHCYFTDNKPVNEKFSKNLSATKSIQITDGKKAISSLRRVDSDSYMNKKTKSLISFSNKSDFLEYFFFLPVSLKEGMKISIQLADKQKFEIGSIEALDTYKKLFVFYGKYIKNQIDHSYDDTSV